MPRHPTTVQNRQRVASIVVYILEILDTSIIVILSGEQSAREVGGVHIREGVGVSVPPPKAEVEPANTGVVVVNDNNLNSERLEGVVLEDISIPSRGETRIGRYLRESSALCEGQARCIVPFAPI